ncbi:MAG TPA: DHH family phosphoesterase [Candidatus Cloacimonas sp.]|jgi:single-stranded-DNA-specific exonuclease|nr:DHH family phosphoesterase [Candidatus Cloacimonas sp.]HNV92534.1 DHH family phosphoesterase [Candidatus Cloacimonas sp.]HOG27253.1 DHH family phosphoesterase [Candidatus Cloacimonas sp.]HOQ78112.1 DHH family phosphoesterase [Candidatus Cloacimonas sp.]HPH71679.1 DHH family phosphoesterase [Candidatus Cloacimonas sp.]
MKPDEPNSNMDSSNDILNQILKSRNLSQQDLQTNLNMLPDEALFANIDKVEHRIRAALYENEPMVIFGHDDPDGITSTYILYNFLNSCGYQKHRYYIPNRNLEPHGIQAGFIDFVREGNYKLIVTVDNGIASLEGVKQLNALGCDVIITDHHIVQPEVLPPAYAIMNPQLPQCDYPFKQLAGVGVVLMLIRYLGNKWEHPIEPASYFWTAVGSVADKVPMIGMNRILVRYALEHFYEIQDDTVEFLLRNYNRINTLSDINSFLQYTAHLLANGRDDKGRHTALRFILQLSDAKADLFQELENQKNKWDSDLNRVFNFLDTLAADFVGNWFVYYDDEDIIPYPLLGTAATYILNKLNIPTLLLKSHNGDTVCEGRCSEGFNIMDAFTHCKKYLKQFGGHPKAAGFTMQQENYDTFLDCFNNFLLKHFHPSHTASTKYDAVVAAKDINRENWQKLEILLPWGQLNPEPTLLIRNTSKAEIMNYVALDNSGREIPNQGKGDILALWKAANMIKVLSWQQTD